VLVLPHRIADQLKAEAHAAAPRECCGALLGRRELARRVVRELRPARNVASTPEVEYVMHPDDLLRVLDESERGGAERQLLGFYHSHPRGPDGMSGTDRSRATWDGFAYVLYAVPDDRLAAWVWDQAERRFRPEELVLDRGEAA